MPELPEIAEAGVAANERFVAENRAMDLAWKNGTLDEWLKERLADERRDATRAAATDQPA